MTLKLFSILLAESHAFTTSERALNGPKFGALRDTYFGPRHFISLVYNLSYGENDSLEDGLQDKNNKGTPQFWTLFAACSRGVHFQPTVGSKKAVNATFAADILKGGGLPVEERLKAKLQVLTDLKERGIWLLDASIFGWYISQQQEYSLSRVSNEIQRRPKARPPKVRVTCASSLELGSNHVSCVLGAQGAQPRLIVGALHEAPYPRCGKRWPFETTRTDR